MSTPGVHSQRVIFVDFARALAALFMLYGHTVSALLDPSYQQGTWFAVWTFQRGLTSCLFLLLSGFAFSIATTRHWALHIQPSPALVKRVRRFGLFIVLGYGLHMPVTQLAHLSVASEAQWRALLAVDVLQLIGVTFIVVQLLVMLARSRQVFMVLTLALGLAITLATPALWRADWSGLPLWLADYLSPQFGSLFPLFPWAAYVLFGAGLGQIYTRWGAGHLHRFTTMGLLAPGAALILLALGVRALSEPVAASAPGAVPTEVVLRAGACLVILSAIARISRHISRLPHIVAAVAQETLLIYFVHLCLVYGSIWNKGLVQAFGATLGPWGAFGCVLLVLGSMAGLAWYWNWFKHVRPRLARWTSYVVLGLLLSKLI